LLFLIEWERTFGPQERMKNDQRTTDRKVAYKRGQFRKTFGKLRNFFVEFANPPRTRNKEVGGATFRFEKIHIFT